jgi:hypothetical protein
MANIAEEASQPKAKTVFEVSREEFVKTREGIIQLLQTIQQQQQAEPRGLPTRRLCERVFHYMMKECESSSKLRRKDIILPEKRLSSPNLHGRGGLF